MELVIVAVIGIVFVLALLSLVGIYNGLVTVRENINKAWANINVLLKQRHDEIPKLVSVCEGYMSHEKKVMDRVMQSREALMKANGPADMGKADGALTQSLRQLFALAENYPQLKAQASFGQLQDRISSLENQIADRREFYNESVNRYNIRIASVPDVFIARFMALTPREMFQIDEASKEDVTIRFNQNS